MSKTLEDTRTAVLYRLGDEDCDIWSADEVDTYLKEGYDELAIKTMCFWDHAALEEAPNTANYTAKWEVAHFDSGQVRYSRFSITDKWEDSYDDQELEPGNHTAAWEWEYLSKNYVSALCDVPARMYQIERAVSNDKRIDPITKRQLETDPRFEYTEGEVEAYAMQYDGIRKFRKYRKPSDIGDMYEYDGTWGLLRDPSDITASTPTGTWGTPRRMDGEAPSTDGTGWGIPRRVYKSTVTRIEFFRRGTPVENDTDEFELPAIYIKYLRHYAMAKALAREGTGQDSALAAHFQARFLQGIARIKARMVHIQAQRIGVVGGLGARPTGGRPPKPKLPWAYGR
jgi:hypothetical protein